MKDNWRKMETDQHLLHALDDGRERRRIRMNRWKLRLFFAGLLLVGVYVVQYPNINPWVWVGRLGFVLLAATIFVEINYRTSPWKKNEFGVYCRVVDEPGCRGVFENNAYSMVTSEHFRRQTEKMDEFWSWYETAGRPPLNIP